MAPDARREQLLDAALQVISRDGYAAVSIEAIAREAEVTRPVVYNVFDGLTPLLFALLDRQEQRALGRLSEAITPVPDPADLPGHLTRTVRELVAMVLEDPLLWRPIFLTHGGTPAAVLERVDRDREVVRERIEETLGPVLVHRADGPPLDAAIVSHALVGIGEHFARLLLERPGDVDVEALTSTVAGLLAAVGP
ncbi:TetR/AcrR family transcriptional regulator [Patulibacter sp.]|uniref:TetR/AcrR family transcriptional regulator n=1 Tax=Patulibacter sp. TaxID=1912859 RepID=UPI00272817A1|nr:TetR/AcrR family transcriptional regulator [Patulibacter sp.]MDO9409768.1 TetR/AcrR family transcriptional regulator [Patulibacter sp.]